MQPRPSVRFVCLGGSRKGSLLGVERFCFPGINSRAFPAFALSLPEAAWPPLFPPGLGAFCPRCLMRYVAFAEDLSGVGHATYELECVDDNDAKHRAEIFLEAHAAIEVWNGMRRVARLTRAEAVNDS
jgi:hypothetical protein